MALWATIVLAATLLLQPLLPTTIIVGIATIQVRSVPVEELPILLLRHIARHHEAAVDLGEVVLHAVPEVLAVADVDKNISGCSILFYEQS